MKCWTNIMDLVMTEKKKRTHFVNWLFAEVGTHFEGGADQRLSRCVFIKAVYQQTHCSGSGTLSQQGAPGEHWGQCFGERSLQLFFQHLLSLFIRPKKKLEHQRKNVTKVYVHTQQDSQSARTWKDGQRIRVKEKENAQTDTDRHWWRFVLICRVVRVVMLMFTSYRSACKEFNMHVS